MNFRPSSPLSGPHVVVFAMFPGIDALDVTGPAEVFAMTNHVLGARRPGLGQEQDQGQGQGQVQGYEVHLAGERRGPVATSAGVRLHVEELFCEQGAIDTLVVPGRIRIGAGGPSRTSIPPSWPGSGRPDRPRAGSPRCAWAHT